MAGLSTNSNILWISIRIKFYFTLWPVKFPVALKSFYCNLLRGRGVYRKPPNCAPGKNLLFRVSSDIFFFASPNGGDPSWTICDSRSATFGLHCHLIKMCSEFGRQHSDEDEDIGETRTRTLCITRSFYYPRGTSRGPCGLFHVKRRDEGGWGDSSVLFRAKVQEKVKC